MTITCSAARVLLRPQAVVLQQLCAYFDVDAPLYQPSRRWSLLDPAEWDQLFLPANQGSRDHQYLLCPVDGDMRYIRRSGTKAADAKVRARCWWYRM